MDSGTTGASATEAAVVEAGLISARTRLLVLLSGGRDSVCLLDLAVRIAGAAQVRALHVNYGLREGADQDQLLCEQLCHLLGVELNVVVAHEPPKSGNLHDWARKLRYSAAAELADGAYIAVAHTATDQAETVLYRLAVSPGRRALLGMRERNDAVLRPLLGVTRAQTGQYCTERNLAFCSDPSNLDPTFARTRVREGLLAAMLEVSPNAVANISTTLELLRAEDEVLSELVAGVTSGRQQIPLAELRELPLALARLVCPSLAEHSTGEYVPQAANRVEELLLMENGGSIDIGAGARACVKDGMLCFEFSTGSALPRRRGELE
mgnify:CR=1 FL=1